VPPPSGGGVTLAEILNVMEGYAPLPPFGSATLMHVQAGALRRAYEDRNTLLGDPDCVSMPLERLLSKAYAATLRAAIDPEHATPTVGGGGPGMRLENPETTHFSIVDAEGNAVSCTTTLNNDFGSAVTVTGAGFLLNDEMDDFLTAPGRPNLFGLVQGEANAIAPGKRMLSAMTPAIVVDPGGGLLRRVPGQTVSDFSSLTVMAAPFGITTSMSRDARAAAAPAAAPAAPPITAPFVFLPTIFPRIAPATAPPATLAASAFVTPRPFIMVSMDTTEASIG